MSNSKEKFLQILHTQNDFIITTHENSDGDGLGAQFALYQYLESLGKNIEIINDDLPQEKYSFLGFNQLVKTKFSISSEDDAHKPFLIMLDCNEKSRVGNSLQDIFEDDARLIRIDHHRNPEKIPESFLIINENASSVCEILFFLLKDEVKNSRNLDLEKWSNCLYTGIIFDTNNFTNANVTPRTFHAAAELRAFGADHSLCHKKIFENKSNSVLKLLGKALSTIEEMEGGRLVFYHITRKMLADCDLEIDASDGFTKEIRPNGKREVVVFIRELDKGFCRVSLRSNGMNVQKIAQKFGGGGHKVAAGFKTEISLEGMKSKLSRIIAAKIDH